MANSKVRRKRSKTTIVMLLPALIVIFIMGWCLYWIGDQKRPDKIKRKPAQKDNVTFMPIVHEETQEIMN